MHISVTRCRAFCLELIRQVESGGVVVEIKRHGKTEARLTPPGYCHPMDTFLPARPAAPKLRNP